MRTTLSLDDDVAALIEKVCKATDASLKEVVNAALREGLAHMVKPPVPRKKFRTAVHSSGRCYLPNLDNTAEALGIAEGEQFK
jgi:Ribbon-helix-helix protein, copG family